MKYSYLLILLLPFLLLSCVTSSPPQKIEVVKLIESSQSWDGSDLPAYLNGQPKVTILKITVPAKTKLHWHRHPVINAGVLLKGSLTMHDEHGNTHKLKEGEGLVELVNTYHYGENTSNKPAVIIVVYAGTVGTPTTVLKDNALDSPHSLDSH